MRAQRQSQQNEGAVARSAERMPLGPALERHYGSRVAPCKLDGCNSDVYCNGRGGSSRSAGAEQLHRNSSTRRCGTNPRSKAIRPTHGSCTAARNVWRLDQLSKDITAPSSKGLTRMAECSLPTEGCSIERRLALTDRVISCHTPAPCIDTEKPNRP